MGKQRGGRSQHETMRRGGIWGGGLGKETAIWVQSTVSLEILLHSSSSYTSSSRPLLELEILFGPPLYPPLAAAMSNSCKDITLLNTALFWS